MALTLPGRVTFMTIPPLRVVGHLPITVEQLHHLLFEAAAGRFKVVDANTALSSNLHPMGRDGIHVSSIGSNIIRRLMV